MTRYASKPVTVEAMQWSGLSDSEWDATHAAAIVTWVNANGGEARYDQHPWSTNDGSARIMLRTINGPAYMQPGHYAVMGDATFTIPAAYEIDHQFWNNGHGQPEHAPYCRCPKREVQPAREVRDFYPCDPETFEKRWERS